MEVTLERVAEKMIEVFGEESLNINAEHFPKCFKYQVDLAKRYVIEDIAKEKSMPVVVENPA